MVFQFLCSEGWKLNQITKNTLRTIYLSVKRQNFYAFCKPSRLSPEKAMQSISMHWERQIYLIILGKLELLVMGKIFYHIWSNFLLKPAEWCPQNYDIYSHNQKKKSKPFFVCAPVMNSCCFHYWCEEQLGKVVSKRQFFFLKGKKKHFS